MTEKRNTSKSAKLLYRPVGIVGSIGAGLIASAIFKQIWKKAAHGDGADPPTPLESEYPLKEILTAAAIQGVIYAVVKALVDRGGARAFEKATGDWPGS